LQRPAGGANWGHLYDPPNDFFGDGFPQPVDFWSILAVMEIHAPEGHIQSLRDVLIHLGIVTAGILIALGLEQTVEWFHHRQQVAEANEMLVQEIRDNRKVLGEYVAKLPTIRNAALGALDEITGMLQKKSERKAELTLVYDEAQLRNTAWETAQAAGAFAHMPYGELSRYSATYRLQDQFLETQKRASDVVSDAYDVWISRGKSGLVLQKMSPSELEAQRARLMHFISTLDMEIWVSEPLRKQYETMLQGRD
jgi:DNA-binding transcriptional regulator PaaX